MVALGIYSPEQAIHLNITSNNILEVYGSEQMQ